MLYITISTTESRSDRFDRLCRKLRSNPMLVLGHLTLWREAWAGTPDRDHGIFWDRYMTDMGRWAEWHDALKFGAALEEAGYIAACEDHFPPELCRGRRGIVALADRPGLISLDTTWNNWHCRSPDAPALCWYLSDSLQRYRTASQHYSPEAIARLAAAKRIPESYAEAALRAGTSAPAQAHARLRNSLSLSELSNHNPDVKTLTLKKFNNVTLSVPPPYPPHGHSGDHHTPGPLPAQAPALHVNVNGNEPNGTEQNGNEHTTAQAYEGAPTGGRRSFGVMSEIRELKTLGQPYRALCLLDSGPRAVAIWQKLTDQHFSQAIQIISELTETDAGWARLKNPAAVAMSRAMRILKG